MSFISHRDGEIMNPKTIERMWFPRLKYEISNWVYVFIDSFNAQSSTPVENNEQLKALMDAMELIKIRYTSWEIEYMTYNDMWYLFSKYQQDTFQMLFDNWYEDVSWFFYQCKALFDSIKF